MSGSSSAHQVVSGSSTPSQRAAAKRLTTRSARGRASSFRRTVSARTADEPSRINGDGHAVSSTDTDSASPVARRKLQEPNDVGSEAAQFASGERVLVPRSSLGSDRTSSEHGEYVAGIIRYLGPVDGPGGGVYAGVELEEPVGKNDGEAKGMRYFTCKENHGIFCRPRCLKKLSLPAPTQVISLQVPTSPGDNVSDSGCSSGPINVSGAVAEIEAPVPIPQEVALSDLFNAKVQELAHRGIGVARILAFYQRLAEGQLRDTKDNTLMPHFDPKKHTTNDVVRQAIIPCSRFTVYGNVAFASVAENNGKNIATVMVSHHWRNLFCHLIASMVAFGLGESSYEKTVRDLEEHRFEDLRLRLHRRDALNMRFWGCLFCVNQHVSICGGMPSEPSKDRPDYEAAYAHYKRETSDPVTGEQFQICPCGSPKQWNDSPHCEMDKFDDMMAVLNIEAPKIAQRLAHVIVVDREFEVFSRIWVMAEIKKGQDLKLTQTALLYGGSEDLSAEEIKKVKDTLDIRLCQASRKEDVDRILAGIEDCDAFNDNLRNVLFNAQTGILETWSAERCAGFFDVIDPLKDLFADLNWRPPEVVTIGQESTGKSTLMERLTGIPVFPRDADLCTRAVIKVRLRRGPVREPRVLVEDIQSGQEECERTVTRQELGDAVLREMTRQVRIEAAMKQGRVADFDDKPLSASDGICTRKVIVVEITSPTSPNLDIADCPGLVAARSRGRPADVVTTTAELVKRYAQDRRDSAIFLVTVSAAEQPNNSLAMQMVQDLELEDRTLCVLTMTDILTGDLTEKGATLQKSFLKHHASRIWSLLCAEDDAGGNVRLGLGYIMTALSDVSKEKGWNDDSRISEMAHWEQLFFSSLVQMWPELDKEVDGPTLKQLVSCNSVWKHVKNEVDGFVRHHWLADTIKFLQEWEAAAVREEKALGIPRALAPEHKAKLQSATDVLPGELRKLAELDGFGDVLELKKAFVARAIESIDCLAAEAWSGGLVRDLETALRAKLSQKLPAQVAAADRNRFAYDLSTPLSCCLADLEEGLQATLAELENHLASRLEAAIKRDESEQRLARFVLATEHVIRHLRRSMSDEDISSRSSFVQRLRPLLGISPGGGLESSPWVRIGRGQEDTFVAQIDREQILNRCSMLFYQCVDASVACLPELVRETCDTMSPEMLVEEHSSTRLALLERMQNLRLASARLRDAFGDDVKRIEEEKLRGGPVDGVGTGRSGYRGRKVRGRVMTAPATEGTASPTSDAALVVPSQRPGGRRGGGMRSVAVASAAGAATWKRIPQEITAIVERWREGCHSRVSGAYSVEQSREVLGNIAAMVDRSKDPILGPEDTCVRWYGESQAVEDGDQMQAVMELVRPNDNTASVRPVNRVIAWNFSDDAFIQKCSSGSSPTDPLRMRCGDQLCVNLHHILPEPLTKTSKA